MRSRTVFIQVPHNKPSGGVKVANQLANLFFAKGWDAYVVVAREVLKAAWLANPAPVLSVEDMARMCEREDLIIDNWPARRTMALTLKLPAATKIFYCQGCSFPQNVDLLGDYFLRHDLGYTHFWAVSVNTLQYLQKKHPAIPRSKWSLVHPYFEHETIQRMRSVVQPKRQILCLGRKGRAYIRRAQKIFGSQIPFVLWDQPFREEEFYALCSQSLFFLNTAIGIDNYHLRRFWRKVTATIQGREFDPIHFIIPRGHREGFPLPPAEAALAGAVVIGFAMGGGLEWMNKKTCFLARDRRLVSLLWQIRKALAADEKELEAKRKAACQALLRFTKEHTWKQIKRSLDL